MWSPVSQALSASFFPLLCSWPPRSTALNVGIFYLVWLELFGLAERLILRNIPNSYQDAISDFTDYLILSTMARPVLETVIIYNFICCIEIQEYVKAQQYLSPVLHREDYLGARQSPQELPFSVCPEFCPSSYLVTLVSSYLSASVWFTFNSVPSIAILSISFKTIGCHSSWIQ